MSTDAFSAKADTRYYRQGGTCGGQLIAVKEAALQRRAPFEDILLPVAWTAGGTSRGRAELSARIMLRQSGLDSPGIYG
jgi:hypothetical protein